MRKLFRHTQSYARSKNALIYMTMQPGQQSAASCSCVCIAQDASSGLASAAMLRCRAVRALGTALEADERLLQLPEVARAVGGLRALRGRWHGLWA